MMERPSLHHNWILKCTAFQVGSDLSPIAIILPRRPRVKAKHTDQRRQTTQKIILAGSTSQSTSPQIASTDTALTMLSP
jgi:hypothetical protein